MIYAHPAAGMHRRKLGHPIYWVLSAVILLFFYFIVERTFSPHGPGWQLLCQGELIDVHAERKLYLSSRSKNFLVHLRITNRTDRPVGVGNASSTPGRAAAFAYWTWWADLDCDCQGEHQFLQPNSGPIFNEMRSRWTIRAFNAGRLVKLAPHQSVDFYAGADDARQTFHYGPLEVSAQCAASMTGINRGEASHRLLHFQLLPSSAVKLWMYGYCLATDGVRAEDVCAPRDAIISAPVPWGIVPAGASVYYGDDDGDYVFGDVPTDQVTGCRGFNQICSLYDGGSYYWGSERELPVSDARVDCKPQSALYHNNCGYGFLDQEYNKYALWHCNLAITRDKSLSTAYNLRALIAYRERRFEAALTDCGKAIKLDPDYAGAHLTRSFVLFELGRYQEALSDARLATHYYPDAYVVMAKSYKGLHRDAKCLFYCNRAIARAAPALYASWQTCPRPYLPPYLVAEALALRTSVPRFGLTKEQVLADFKQALLCAWEQEDHYCYGEYRFGNRDAAVVRTGNSVPERSREWIVRHTLRINLNTVARIHEHRADYYKAQGLDDAAKTDLEIAKNVRKWLAYDQAHPQLFQKK